MPVALPWRVMRVVFWKWHNTTGEAASLRLEHGSMLICLVREAIDQLAALAREGPRQLTAQRAATGATDEQEQLKPFWNKNDRKLWYGDTLCASYTRSAPRQETIFDAFQDDGWPSRIDDPLHPGKLADTISDIQRKVRDTPLAFERDGTGEGVLWRPRSEDRGTDLR
jgi:hypothetical protein